MSGDVMTVLRHRPHKNSSQRRMFEMPGYEMEYVRRSTTHETYRPRTPVANKLLDDKEKKRKEFKEHLWKTITEQVMNDIAVKAKYHYDQNIQFKTTYNSTFQIEGFTPKEIGETLDEECSPQMYDFIIVIFSFQYYFCHFRIYSCGCLRFDVSEPQTTTWIYPKMTKLCAKYPLYNTNGMSVPVNRYECYKAKQSVHKSLAHLFKRDSRFTSRMSNPNDYHAPVDPGHFAFI